MGFLDRFRGGDRLALSLAVSPAEVAPGGGVVVRFEASGEPDPQARAIRVCLEGTASYLVQVSRTHGEADRGDTSRTEEWRSYQLHEEERELPAQVGPGEVTFTLPPDALPSSAGAVAWTVSARVDRKGLDKVERETLDVRHGAEGLPSTRSPEQHEDGLTLDDVPVAVRAGDTLGGHLTISPRRDVGVTAVRIRLHRRVTYTAAPQTDGSIYGDEGLLSTFTFVGSGRITRDTKVAEVDLAGKRDFVAGSIERLPFSVDVPATAGPTTAHRYARVEWRVEAVLDRRLRDDLAVTAPVVVR